ncbi:MAG: hypothetical protein R2713_08410 [Ilumatobacteraceae bacterium]
MAGGQRWEKVMAFACNAERHGDDDVARDELAGGRGDDGPLVIARRR